MQKKYWLLLFIIIFGGIEAYFAHQSFVGLTPFPYNEFYFKTIDHLLRDGLFAVVAWALYYRKGRIKDRVERYFPVIVIGLLYVVDAVFMVRQLSLDFGLQTALTVLAGINNNIFFVQLVHLEIIVLFS